MIPSVTIVVDKTPPTGSIKINNDASYTTSTSVTLGLSATDTGDAGIDKLMFSLDNLNWLAPLPYTTNASTTLSSTNGIKYAYVKFSDKAGNWSQVYSDSIILDNTKPVISGISDSPDPFYPNKGQASKINYTATDNLAGSLSVSVSIYTSGGGLVRTLGPYSKAQGASYITWDGKNSSGAVVGNATYKYNIKAVDAAGNTVTSVSYSVTKK